MPGKVLSNHDEIGAETRAHRRAYNAGMEHFEGPAAQVDDCLRAGGLVVTASERAARALTAAFHRARRADRLTAWPAPRIRHWQSFVREAWDEAGQGAGQDDRLILNALQERALWAEIVGASGAGTALLEAPRHRMAAMAMEAHARLCAYAPQLLNESARAGWQADAAAFSSWLSEFDTACRERGLMSAARLPQELRSALPHEEARPLLLLAGFDRRMPVQTQVFDAWGRWTEASAGPAAREVSFFEAADEQAELASCAAWCRRMLDENSHARLLVVSQDISERRGEIERAFLRSNGAEDFEFSLGLPLGQMALARGARLVLRWLAQSIEDPLEEHEVDWLLASGQTAGSDAESYALTGFMRALRRRGLERTRWSLESLVAQRVGVSLPAAWVGRMRQARGRLEEFNRRPQSPLAWAELVPQLLEMTGWPYPEGSRRPLSSAEFQVLQRFQQTLEDCASLGFDERRMSWDEFLKTLGRALDETLFAPESHDAPIQIAGPAESAGLTADAVWFLGANEDAWPSAGSMHPLIPFDVQSRYEMPHSSAQLDWEVARAATLRLLASAPEVRFSYARQAEGVEMRPSRLAAQCAGRPQPLPAEFAGPQAAEPVATAFEDSSQIPLAAAGTGGGSSVLTFQSQCPFKAFATARLNAQGWEPAQVGLTPAVRGKLLHEVLHSVWAGAPAGIRTHAELAAKTDLRGFVAEHVGHVLREQLPAGVREQAPQRYLELEEMRLTALVTEWLEFECARVPFDVARTELDVTRSIAGLTLKLRLDRIDRLSDGSLLVIDYKTGDVSPKVWEMPRPDDVQLPLYAGFGLDEQLRTELQQESGNASEDETAGQVGGLVFAKVRAGKMCFDGRVGDAKATLLADLRPTKGLVKRKLTAKEMDDWRQYIEKMASDFVAGCAEVYPRDLKTCERCDLHAVCRIEENRPIVDDSGADAEIEEAGDE